jgi:hypothetical protein
MVPYIADILFRKRRNKQRIGGYRRKQTNRCKIADTDKILIKNKYIELIERAKGN